MIANGQVRRVASSAMLLGVLFFVAAAGGAGIAAKGAANAGWEEVGAASASFSGIFENHDGTSITPVVVMAADNWPIIVWDSPNSGNSEIYIRRWNGAQWVDMDGSDAFAAISGTEGRSLFPSVALLPDNTPIVAWSDDSNGVYEIYVRRWNGSAWVEMGGSATGGGISNNDGWSIAPSVAVAPDGTPMIAWRDESSGDGEVYVRRWDGSAWVEMDGSATDGGISDNNGASFGPSLAIAGDGSPIVAWNDNSSGNWEIYVRRWNGFDWEEMGVSASGGGISNNEGASLGPSLAITPNDTPIIAWYDDSNGLHEIYVRRWDGSAWVEMDGSATSGGTSDNDGASVAPSLAMAPGGQPIVAWHDNSVGNPEIYVRRWDGTAWLEFDAGSADQGGISNTSNFESSPSLAISALDGKPVIAWGHLNLTSSTTALYVRQHDPILPERAYAPVIVLR